MPEPLPQELIAQRHCRGPVPRLTEAGAAGGLEAVVTAGDPAQLHLPRKVVGLHLNPPPEAVPLPLQDQGGSAQVGQVLGAQLQRLAGRVEGIAQAKTAAHPSAGGQRIDQQAGHPSAHRLAADEQRPARLLRSYQAHLLAERLLQHQHPIGPLAAACLTHSGHVRKFKAHHPPARLGQSAGDGSHERTVHRCTGPMGQQHHGRRGIGSIDQAGRGGGGTQPSWADLESVQGDG